MLLLVSKLSKVCSVAMIFVDARKCQTKFKLQNILRFVNGSHPNMYPGQALFVVLLTEAWI